MLRVVFVPLSQGSSGSCPQGVLPDSWVTAWAPLFRLDFSTPPSRTAPLFEGGESASSITDTKALNSLLYNWKGFCCEQEGVQEE